MPAPAPELSRHLGVEESARDGVTTRVAGSMSRTEQAPPPQCVAANQLVFRGTGCRTCSPVRPPRAPVFVLRFLADFGRGRVAADPSAARSRREKSRIRVVPGSHRRRRRCARCPEPPRSERETGGAGRVEDLRRAISRARATRRSTRSTRTTSRSCRSRGGSNTDIFGPRPDTLYSATPLMVGGVLYTTAGHPPRRRRPRMPPPVKCCGCTPKTRARAARTRRGAAPDAAWPTGRAPTDRTSGSST